MKTLGFIIPIYNIRKEWIKKCLESMIMTAAFTNDFEVIVIDNGSTDLTIWPWLIENYSRFSKFMHLNRLAVNHGKKQATTYGLNHLQTKYIQVLDSDDWIISWRIPKIISILKATSAELYFLNYNYFSETRQKIRKNRKISNSRGDFKRLKSVPRFLWHFDTNTILNREFMKKNHFSFPATIKFYEDVYINMWNLSKAKNIFYINETIYNYRVNLNGTNLSSLNKLVANIEYYKTMVNSLETLDYNNKITQNHMLFFFSLQLLSYLFLRISAENELMPTKFYNEVMADLKQTNADLYFKVNGYHRLHFNIVVYAYLWGYNPIIKPASKFILKVRK